MRAADVCAARLNNGLKGVDFEVRGRPRVQRCAGQLQHRQGGSTPRCLDHLPCLGCLLGRR
jgi:hypothetical protein